MSNSTSRTRTCLGCEGTGLAAPYGTGWEHRPACAIFAAPRVLGHLDGLACDCTSCPACLGSGSVTVPDPRQDAMVDAETLRQAWDQCLGWRELHPYLGTYCKAGLPLVDYPADWYPRMAEEAARAAFRAVPALKDAQ